MPTPYPTRFQKRKEIFCLFVRDLNMDPRGAPSGSGRVYRGGSWSGRANGCRLTGRGDGLYGPAGTSRGIGFRLARSLETQAAMDAELSWDSLAGKTYAVERSTDLTSWQVIAENIPATLPRNTYTDQAPLSQARAFYHVLER